MIQYFSSLRIRILLIITFTILPSLAVFYATNQEERQKAINHAKQDLREIAEVITLQETDLLDGTRQLLMSISLLEDIRNFNSNECNSILSNLLNNSHRYLNFGVANINGDVVCSALPLTENVNIADRQYFKRALSAQEFTIGGFQLERVTRRPAINFGYPIFGESGRPAGVVFATFDMEQFAQLEERLSSKIPEDAILTKTDKNGIVIARVPGGEELIGEPAPETEVILEALKSNTGTIQITGKDGRLWIYVFDVIKSNIYQGDLHLILGRPQETMLAEANHSFNRNLLIMGIVGVVLLIGTWLGFEISFMRQIQALLLVTNRLANGDLNARYYNSPYGTSELNDLGASFNQMAIALKQREDDLLQAYDTTIEGWSRALDLRDKETEGHTLRVTEMTVELARLAGMSEDMLIHVRRGALLHDIGKMGVPDSILLKPENLTDEEWAIMRKHPQLAYEMLSPITYLKPALDIPYCHHEKWDGSGYPRGLKGEQIPLAARLFAVVDVWDALRSDRPYRQGWAEEKVLEFIKTQSGTHFDPAVVDLFLKMMSKHS